MKSNSADPDFVRMSRFNVAIDASLRSISSATTAGSVSIGAGASPVGVLLGPSSGRVGMKSPRSRMFCSASPDQRIASPHDLQEVAAARWRRQARGDVDEQPSAGLVHWPGGRQLPKGEPQRLHGVGHHLPMADRDVDMVLSVAGRGDGEQRGDRSALDDLEAVLDQAPFDVLGITEVRFDPSSQLRQSHDLRIGQCCLLLPLRVDRFFLRPACR